MIWIIASLPLWSLAVLIFVLGAACSICGVSASIYRIGIYRGTLDKPRSSYLLIGIACLLTSWILAAGAAKICS